MTGDDDMTDETKRTAAKGFGAVALTAAGALGGAAAAGTDASSWATIAERVGIPFAVVILLALVGIGFARWLASRVAEPLVRSHTSMVDRVASAVEAQAKTSEASLEVMTRLERNTARHQEAVERLLGSNAKKEGGP